MYINNINDNQIKNDFIKNDFNKINKSTKKKPTKKELAIYGKVIFKYSLYITQDNHN